MRIILASLFFSISSLWFISSAQGLADLSEIKQSIADFEYSKALAQLRRTPTDSTQIEFINNLKAKCHYHLGHWHESKLIYEELLKGNADHHESLNYLSRIYEQESNWPKAIKYNLALLSTDTANVQYLKRIGLLHIKINESQSAIDYLSKSMKRRSDDVVVVKELATLLMNIDSMQIADSLIQKALIANPDHVSLNMVAAQIQYKNKAYAETVKSLEFVKRKIDLNEYFVKMLGYSYLRIDSVDKAIHQLENIVHGKEGEFIHYYLALAYEKKEDFDRALFHYDHAINKSISPRIDIYCANASAIQYEQNEVNDAIDYLQLAHRYTDKDKYLFELAKMSDLYYKDKKIAIRYYNRYIKSGATQIKNKTYAEQRMNYLKELEHQKQ